MNPQLLIVRFSRCPQRPILGDTCRGRSHEAAAGTDATRGAAMDAGLGAAQFRHMAEAVARTDGAADGEPVAVVRCADGWRTLFADGSSHEGRPCSADVMDELGRMVDRWRADNAELESLAAQWVPAEEVDDAVRTTDPAGVTATGAAPRPAPAEVTRLTLRSLDTPVPETAPRRRAPASAAAFRPAVATDADSAGRFVPWSVVEAMIDVEVDAYYRRAS